MPRLVAATGNAGKIAEIRMIVGSLGFDVVSLLDLEDLPEVVEDSETFAGNAAKKAREIGSFLNCAALADDSGLCVDGLDGEPGVFSARYGGPGLDDAGRNALLLENMKHIPLEKRTASFQCALAFFLPGEEVKLFAGKVGGRIANSISGTGGFGYDPVFIPEGFNKTMAELGLDLKNEISHRARALMQFSKWMANRTIK